MKANLLNFIHPVTRYNISEICYKPAWIKYLLIITMNNDHKTRQKSVSSFMRFALSLVSSDVDVVTSQTLVSFGPVLTAITAVEWVAKPGTTMSEETRSQSRSLSLRCSQSQVSVKCDNENSVPRIIVIQSLIPTEKIKQVEKGGIWEAFY